MMQQSLDEINLILEHISSPTEVDIKLSCTNFKEQIKGLSGKLDENINKVGIVTHRNQ